MSRVKLEFRANRSTETFTIQLKCVSSCRWRQTACLAFDTGVSRRVGSYVYRSSWEERRERGERCVLNNTVCSVSAQHGPIHCQTRFCLAKEKQVSLQSLNLGSNVGLSVSFLTLEGEQPISAISFERVNMSLLLFCD